MANLSKMSDTATFKKHQIDILRSAYATLETMPLSKADEFLQIIHGCGRAALAQLAGARIKFCSIIAANAYQKRYGVFINCPPAK